MILYNNFHVEIEIIDYNNGKKFFLRFLKEKDIYSSFMKQKKKEMSEDIFNIIKPFDYGLIWRYTKEGYGFWKYIQLEYIYSILKIYVLNDKTKINPYVIDRLKRNFCDIYEYIGKTDKDLAKKINELKESFLTYYNSIKV